VSPKANSWTKAEQSDITKLLTSNMTGNRQMPLPNINLKQAFVAQSVLPAALLRSENDAVFLNKNKYLNTENKGNVSYRKENYFLFSVWNCEKRLFVCRQIIFGATSGTLVTLLYGLLCSLRIRELWTCCWQWVLYISKKKICMKSYYWYIVVYQQYIIAKRVYFKFETPTRGSFERFTFF